MSRRPWAPVVLLQTANLASGVSNATVMVLVPWLVIEVTGSAWAAGLVAAASSILGIFVAPAVGVLIDRVGRRLVSIGSDVLSALSTAAFPLLALVMEPSLTSILILACVGAAFDPAGYTARKSMIPDAATASRVDVNRLNGIHEGLFAIGWAVGPVVAATLISLVGAISAYWAPTVLFVLAAGCVALMRVGDAGQEARAAKEAAGHESERFWTTATRGAQVIWRDGVLRALTLAVMVLAAVYLPIEAIILPFHFEGLGQPERFGLLITALAGGGAIGAFSYGWLARRLRLYTITCIALSGTIVAVVPLSLFPPFPLMLVAAAVMGVAWGPMNPLLNTVVQRRVDADEQGRVYGVQTSLFYAAPPVAMLIVGGAVTGLGLAPTFLALAVLLTAVCVAILFVPAIRRMDT